MLILILFSLSGPAFAASGTMYLSSPEQLFGGGGKTEGSSYTSTTSIGNTSIGTAEGTSYSISLGFLAASISYATSESSASVTIDSPGISSLKFDGRTIADNEYVSSDVTITATVSDLASSINTAISSVEIDSTVTSLANLSGDSSYNATTSLLTYKSATALTTGTHTFTIYARNNAGELTSQTTTFKVESGNLLANTVLAFPNPYNPNNGNLEITYNLSKDSTVSVYIFNTLGQLIWKQDYLSGAAGGYAGYNSVNWDGVNGFGQAISNDVYLCRIVSEGNAIGKCKIAVLR
ncbi:MAG: hypothetical protein HQ564_01470 [Candidatus Saganbacteria bacterium]|nr:hypothetical protein [Candidatus Saganbacteria bacterium]